MKNFRTLIILTLLFSVLVLLMTIMDFLALHDIKQDYLSKTIIDYLGITFSKEIPDWTATSGEWRSVTISLYSRLIFFFLNIFVLYQCINKLQLSKNST